MLISNLGEILMTIVEEALKELELLHVIRLRNATDEEPEW